MSSLPPEIITDLLSRLPVKSLLRFRSVSKPWCSQIDGPDFIKLHLAQSIATSSNLSIFTESNGTLYSLDSDSFENVTKIKTPFNNRNHKVILFNSCNGLLLLRINNGVPWKNQGLVLFNPSTKKHFVLPDPPPHTNYAGMASARGSTCLGYDALNDDYKVINVLLVLAAKKEEFDSFIACEARVYSLKSNSWLIIKDFAKGVKNNGPWGAYVNGALHAVDCETPRNIVAYDIGNESFKLISMPEFRDKEDVSIITAHVFDGCLTVLCRYPENRTDIWVMKEYGVKESWSMLVSVQTYNPCMYVTPVVYSKTRGEVLLSYDNRKLVWYDLRKNTLRDFRVRGLPIGFEPVVCVGSLVSVGRSGKTNEKKKQQGEEKMKERKVEMKGDDFLLMGFELKL